MATSVTQRRSLDTNECYQDCVLQQQIHMRKRGCARQRMTLLDTSPWTTGAIRIKGSISDWLDLRILTGSAVTYGAEVSPPSEVQSMLKVGSYTSYYGPSIA